MSERPTTIHIGFMPFEIQWINDSDWPEKDAEDSGVMDGARGEIRIRVADYTHEMNLREVLLHEIMHGIYFVSQLSTVNWKEIQSDDVEEESVRRITPPLLSVLRDNEDVLEYITNA